MATNTTNLNLIKPSGTDKIRITQINQNMDILDAKIGSVGNTSLQAQIAAVDSGLAIVSNGNTHVAITSGQYVYIRNHGSLSEGLYKAKAAIAANVALSTSNVTKLTTGSANDLKSAIDSLNSQIAKVKNFGIAQVQATLVNQVTIGAGQDGKIFNNVNLKTGNVLTTFVVGSQADIPDTVTGVVLLWMSGGGNCFANDQIAWTDGKVTLGVKNIGSGIATITAVRLLLFGTYN